MNEEGKIVEEAINPRYSGASMMTTNMNMNTSIVD